MGSSQTGAPSAFTKMRQVYWEARQSFNQSLGQREDSCIISSDMELDIRLDLLQTADNSFNALMRVLLDYRRTLQDVINTQDSLGMALIEYGTKDATAAGKIMCVSGRAISKAAHRQSLLKTSLMNLFHEVETFQFKATSDALLSVTKMEKVRRSYRSGLMWLKSESEDLDPDVNRKLRNFRKVQEQIKRLKVRFDRVKLECLQKTDLFLLSRSNLFSHSVPPYTQILKKICKQSAICMRVSLENIPLCLSYNFVALKELNEYSSLLQASLQKQLSSADGKQKKNRKSAKKSMAAAIFEQGPSIANLPDSNISNELLLPGSNYSGDSPLIDLNEEKRGNRRQAEMALERHHNLSSESASKYSEDLSSIELEDFYRPSSFRHVSLAGDFASKFEHSVSDSVFQENASAADRDLHFWSLMQSADQSSKPQQRNDPNFKNDPSVTQNQASESKWKDILIQFDPFLDENPKLKSKNESLELC